MSLDAENMEYGILDSLPSGIVILDVDGIIVAINRFQKKMFQLFGDVLGKNLFDIGLNFLKSNDQPFLPDEYPLPRSKTGSDCVSGFEHKVKLISGGVIDISLNSSLYVDLNGRTLVMISYVDITHHQQVEKKLHENTLRLERVIRNEPLVLFELDIDGNFTFSDGKALETLGLKPGEVIGQSVFELYKDFPEMLEEMRKGLRGETVSFTVDVNGIIFESILTPVYDESGLFVSLLGISIEQTQQKKAEESLRESQKILMDVIQNAPIVLLSIDDKGLITMADGYGLKKLGLDSSELKGESIYELYKNNNDVISLVNRALKGEAFSAKVSFSNAVLITSYKPIFDNEDNVVGATAVSFDITDRENIEQKLAESNRKLAEAQHIAHVGNWTWDFRINEMTGSVEAFKLFGIPDYKKIVTYDDMMKLIHPDDKDMASKIVTSAMDSGHDYALELRISSPEIPERIVLTHGRIVTDADGQPEQINGTIQDVTEMRKTEKALRAKDREIQEAYSDVFSAVTGDKLLITTKEVIDQSLGKQVGETFSISDFADLSRARERIKDIMEKYFPDLRDSYDILVSAGEITTNAIKHAGGCEVSIYRNESSIQLKVTDSGPGIDFSILPKATLVPGFSTEQSLGLGFSIILEICNRVLLTTQPGHTSVVLELDADASDKEIAA